MKYKKLSTDNSGEFILIDGHMALKEDVIIEISDYGDEYFDVGLVYKETGDLFGSSISAPIKGYGNALKYARDLTIKHGLDFRVNKTDPNDLYLD